MNPIIKRLALGGALFGVVASAGSYSSQGVQIKAQIDALKNDSVQAFKNLKTASDNWQKSLRAEEVANRDIALKATQIQELTEQVAQLQKQLEQQQAQGEEVSQLKAEIERAKQEIDKANREQTELLDYIRQANNDISESKRQGNSAFEETSQEARNKGKLN